MPAPIDPHFYEVDAGPLGRRFAVHHPPQGPRMRGLVVYVHPFAEEMNKARRMAALQSRALAQAGYAVLQPDLLGCGESAGDFGDATWARWVDDVVHACHTLRQRHGPSAPLWLWGLRAGCLLAAQAAERLAAPCHFVFWQPPASGRLLLQQFLRLKAAAELMGGQAKAAMETLRAEIAAGRDVEIAGYRLSAELCKGLEQAEMTPPPGRQGHVLWLETSPADPPALSPASQAGTRRWQDAGWSLQAQCARGPAFWQTAEIEDAPHLLQVTAEALTGALDAPAAQVAEAVRA